MEALPHQKIPLELTWEDDDKEGKMVGLVLVAVLCFESLGWNLDKQKGQIWN